MALDNVFYCDFSKEIPLTNWEVLKEDGKNFVYKVKVTTKGGNFLVLSRINHHFEHIYIPELTSVTFEGKEYFPSDRLSYVISPASALRKEIPIFLPEGEVELILSGICGISPDGKTYFNPVLSPIMSKVETCKKYSRFFTVEEEEYPAAAPLPDLTSYTPGIGTENNKGPGRFGYTKGDGLLDCAMPCLGQIDKLYLLGHPKYQKTFRWYYSTLPAGASRHGSFVPANTSLKGDKISINHLSCRWESSFDGKAFTCTYSLATPGIITENESGILRLSNLEFAGNYQYMMIPRKDGSLEVASLRDVTNLEMGENFLLLFGCTEFPDLPLLLVFQEKPEKMLASFDPLTNRLTELVFTNCPLIITSTPFGFESFQPISPDDTAFLEKAVRKCRFWKRAFLAYPIACEEYFKLDEEKETIAIIQKFSYRYIRDAWATPPLELAPIPPVASLGSNTISDGLQDFDFPTKFGPLQGVIGTCSSYTIPCMPRYRKFPLRDIRTNTLSDMLNEGMESYLKVVSHFPDTIQSYPYAGALVEPFALVSSQLQFLTPENREKLRAILTERLKTACDPDHSYDYPVIRHGYMMERMPDDEEVIEYTTSLPRKRLYNWYERFEPFTKTQFTICYLNVGLFSGGILNGGDKDEVRQLEHALIENDWGVGLTFYYMYLAALASGSFQPIKEEWQLMKDVFSFFEKMHDWACMGTGYSDNAILWVEGANYGAFTSFIHMAEVVGDEETYRKAQYMAAKQFTLRSAVFRSTQHYFYKYYDVPPWHIAKLLTEEQCISYQHMGVPRDLGPHRFREDGVYNMTTEGIYPEIFEGFRRYLPEETKLVMEKLLAVSKDLPWEEKPVWHSTQQFASLLTYMANSPDFTREELEKVISLAKEKNRWMGKWRGIHIFSRRLPEKFFASLLYAWDAGKNHPCQIVHHQEILLDDALWTGEKALIQFRLSRKGGKALIKFEIKEMPEKILLNGKLLEGEKLHSILTLPLEEEGTLELIYKN